MSSFCLVIRRRFENFHWALSTAIDPLNHADTGQNDDQQNKENQNKGETDVQIRQLRSFVFVPFMTMTLLNYDGGKNDDQQNKENQDKTEMTSKSKSRKSAHSFSLLSTKFLYYILLFRKCLGKCLSKSLIFRPTLSFCPCSWEKACYLPLIPSFFGSFCNQPPNL
jgi:hypothetical protein